MKRTRQQIVDNLLAHPEKMLLKKPFTRGTGSLATYDYNDGDDAYTTERREAVLPHIQVRVVSQERFAKELDPNSHGIIFDTNVPSICVKRSDGSYQELEFKRFGLAFQQRIREKKTLSLCGNKRVFTLHDANPSEKLKKNYADYKWHWQQSNQDGLDCKAVYAQQGYGDVGLLMYYNEKGECRGRIFSYEDGYQIISHNDDNGERVMECVYYQSEDGVRHLFAYDDTYCYDLTDDAVVVNKDDGGWRLVSRQPHGFSEIPLITKRGDVAWNNVQGLIELYEIIYNIFAVIQKRHGWGILYVRGKFKEDVRKIAGSIILNDTSIDGNGSAEFKTPPSPTGTLDFLQSILDQIQIGCGATFILPKDIKTGGDLSGLAIQMTRSFDIETAAQAVIDWQDFADKHCRLYKEGLAKQLVNSGENPNAITEFAEMNITCRFNPWQPFDEGTYNQMLCTLKGAGVISTKTAVEKNTISAPDEEVRINSEREEANKLASQQTDTQAIVNTDN